MTNSFSHQSPPPHSTIFQKIEMCPLLLQPQTREEHNKKKKPGQKLQNMGLNNMEARNMQNRLCTTRDGQKRCNRETGKSKRKKC